MSTVLAAYVPLATVLIIIGLLLAAAFAKPEQRRG